jgi:predicted DNA-binding protein with PD1-like motif
MEIFEDRPAGIVVVGLKRGERIFESLEAVARQCDIHTGIVTSGIGSLTKGYIHTVDSNDYPPKEEYMHLEGPLEVVNFGGVIANYQPHIHISLWDKDRNYYGGHVHEGCEILTLSEISIRRLPELRLVRRALDPSGVQLLTRE